MGERSGRLFGRDRAIRLVWQLMERPLHNGRPASADHPVVIFEGAPGSGKTALVTELHGLLEQVVPYARIDFGMNRDIPPHRILAALAFELSRRCNKDLVLRFPRLLTGRTVMRMDLDQEDRERARLQVHAELNQESDSSMLAGLLREAATGVLVYVGKRLDVPLPELDPFLAPGANWLARKLRRSITLGAYLAWYGHRGRGLANDATDVLVDLNSWAHRPEDEDGQQRVNELLWDAFLTDLREGFTGARHANELTRNCVILLDNIDTGAGAVFVDQLIRARRERVGVNRHEPEPLTVVATSRGAYLAQRPTADWVDITDHEDTRRLIQPARTVRWWLCRDALTDLGNDHVGAMVTALELPNGNTERLTTMVYQLTGGHPATTRLVLRTVARYPELRNDLAVALRMPEPEEDTGRLVVLARIRQLLLPQFSDEPEDTDNLVTCAVANSRVDAQQLAKRDALFGDGIPNYLDTIDPVLWPATAGAGPALLRRILLPELAAREPNQKCPDWTTAFGWLRDHCAPAKSPAGPLYYALAAGDVALVAAQLHASLHTTDATAWLADLDLVTSAPLRANYEPAGPTDHTPTAKAHELVTGVGPLALGRLIAALQVVTDPLTDSRRRGLHLQIAHDYEAVADLSEGVIEPMLRRAREHRRQADLWQ